MGWADDYEPVENRLRDFWSDHPNGRIVTRLLSHDAGEYVVQASVWRDETSDAITPSSTGLAHDSTANLPPNMKASALEVCETSAVGRALANLGYAPKGKRPSREEMQKSGPSALGEGSGGPDPKSAPASGSSARFDGAGTAAPSGGGSQGTSPAAGDHKHEWKPSPNMRGWRVCNGCGKAEKGEA